jgi:hypothetical protein
MKRFKEYFAEMFLLEGKIDDLKAQNPGLHPQIDAYADADPSPTKKFVPWLVSQHKKGNVTPDHPDLHAVLGNYDRYKNIHGIKDHASKTFQEVHSTIMPLTGFLIGNMICLHVTGIVNLDVPLIGNFGFS